MRAKLISGLLFCGLLTTSAQTTLTYSFNAPIFGDVFTSVEFDTTTALNRAGGIGQVWDYSSVISSTRTPYSINYVNPVPVTGYSAFPGANLAYQGVSSMPGTYYFINSSVNGEELLGSSTGTTLGIYTNTFKGFPYPFGFGSSFQDTYMYSGATGSTTGSYTITGSGTGTLILPGNIVLNNCLQLKASYSEYGTSQPSPLMFAKITQEVLYYHSASKFKVMGIKQSTTTVGTMEYRDYNIYSNSVFFPLGVKESTSDIRFDIFPNPVFNKLNLHYTAQHAGTIQIILYDLSGKEIKSFNSKNEKLLEMDLSDMETGIYFIQIIEGNHRQTKKFIKLPDGYSR